MSGLPRRLLRKVGSSRNSTCANILQTETGLNLPAFTRYEYTCMYNKPWGANAIKHTGIVPPPSERAKTTQAQIE